MGTLSLQLIVVSTSVFDFDMIVLFILNEERLSMIKPL